MQTPAFNLCFGSTLPRCVLGRVWRYVTPKQQSLWALTRVDILFNSREDEERENNPPPGFYTRVFSSAFFEMRYPSAYLHLGFVIDLALIYE